MFNIKTYRMMIENNQLKIKLVDSIFEKCAIQKQSNAQMKSKTK